MPSGRVARSGSSRPKGNIARIDNAGFITEARTVKNSEPFGIAVAENGDPWYAMMEANRIATLQLR